jgi:hypothetical protein
VVIRDVKQFSEKVIPTAYKHNNFSSFVRQLNFCKLARPIHVFASTLADIDVNSPTDPQMASGKSSLSPWTTRTGGNSDTHSSFATSPVCSPRSSARYTSVSFLIPTAFSELH